jgi:hypothetical protein
MISFFSNSHRKRPYLASLLLISAGSAEDTLAFTYMKYPPQMDESSDFEKLTKALSTLTGKFASFDDFLEAFGLASMPAAQRYGIMFGFLVFILTVAAVVMLLTIGGSFKRMQDQAKQEVCVPDVVAARVGRALLFERLLEARDRMISTNYEKPVTASSDSKLTTMLLNVDIGNRKLSDLVDHTCEVKDAQQREFPTGYQADYVEAYRKCQDKLGGKYQRLRRMYIKCCRSSPILVCCVFQHRSCSFRTPGMSVRSLCSSLGWLWETCSSKLQTFLRSSLRTYRVCHSWIGRQVS